ncbi:hypothetical protein J437_LFUL013193, partial [Ladona fulva]
MVFKGKTASQLEALQSQIEGKISGKPEGVDIGYWESLLSQLKAHMARARLRDRHQENLRRKLEVLKAEQGVCVKEEELVAQQEESASEAGSEADNKDAEEEDYNANQVANAMLSESFADFESGGYSPVYLSQYQLEPGTLIVSEEDDLQRLAFTRVQVQGTGSRVE